MSRPHQSLRRLEALAAAAPAAIAGLEREDELLAPLLRELDDLDLVSAALLTPLVEPADLSAALAGRLGRGRRSRRPIPRPARQGAPLPADLVLVAELLRRHGSGEAPVIQRRGGMSIRANFAVDVRRSLPPPKDPHPLAPSPTRTHTLPGEGEPPPAIPADPERVAELLRRHGPGEAPVIPRRGAKGPRSLAPSPTIPLGVNVPVAGAFPRPTSPPRSPSPISHPTPGRGRSLKYPRFPETLVQERVGRGRPSPGGGGAMGEGSGVRSGGGRLAGEGLAEKLTPEWPQDAGEPTAGPAGVRLEAILDRLRTGSRLRQLRQRRTAVAAGAPPAPAAGLSAPPLPARGLRALAALGTALPADPPRTGGGPSPSSGESSIAPPWEGGDPLAAELSADDLAARIDRLLRREARRHGIEVDAP